MPKLLPVFSDAQKKIGYCFKCPACGYMHKICTADAHTEGWPIWTLTGTLDNPTVRASILVTGDEGNPPQPTRCHSFITDGKIEYCEDCNHSMAGQTVELPEL